MSRPRWRRPTVAAVFTSHYRHNPLQLTGLILIVTAAITLWSGVSALTGQARTSLERSEAAVEPELQVVRLDGAATTREDFATLRRAGVCVTPRLNVEIDAQPELELIGTDPLSAACVQKDDNTALATDNLSAGLLEPRLWGNADTLSRWEEYRLQLGWPSVELVTDPALPADTLVGDIGVVARYRGAGRDAGRSKLTLVAPSDTTELPAQYRTLVRDYGVTSAGLADSFLLNLDALGLLALLVATLLVRSVFAFGLSQREETLAVLHRFGVSRTVVLAFLATELLIIGTVGGSLGVLLGGEVARLFSSGVRATLTGLFSADTGAFTGPTASDWIQSGFIVFLVVVWACADQLWRIVWRRRRAGRDSRNHTALATAIALLVALAGTALVTAADSLWQLYGGIALGLGGLALCLPHLMVASLGWWQRKTADPLREWSLSEMRGLARSMSLPLVALALAIATTIGVYTMVTSFEKTFVRWLDQRLQGDLYLIPEDNPVVPALTHLNRWREILDRQPEINQVHPVVRGKGLLGREPVDIVAVNPHSPLLRDWDFLRAVKQPWKALSEGPGVLVNEQLARRSGLQVGSPVRVTVGDRIMSAPVLAIYADYGRPAGEVLFALGDIDGTLPGWSLSFVLTMDTKEPEHWSNFIENADLPPFSGLRNQKEVKRMAEAAFSRTFAITQALSGLTLTLSGVALALIGYTSFRVRRPLYALLHVFGLTSGQVKRRLIGHSVALALLLAALAVPLGVALSWVLVARVNPLAFGWALPFEIYPGFWLVILCASGGLGLIVGLLMGNPVRLEQLKRGLTVSTVVLLLVGCGPANAPDQPGGFASLGSRADEFAQPYPGMRIDFPDDMGSHPDYRIEWWYLTANLKAEDGTPFGIQWTLFRQSLTPPTDNLDVNEWDTHEVWMAHAALSRPEAHHFAEKFARGGTGQAGAEAAPFRAWLDDWEMAEAGNPNAFTVRAAADDFRYRLDLKRQGPIVKHGVGGFSAKSPSGQGSLYFSLPNLEVSGVLEVSDTRYQVKGQGWIDREWSSQFLQSDQRGWDWFSLHLDDGSKLMVFQLRSDRPFYAGTLIAPDGSVSSVTPDQIRLTTAEVRQTDHGEIPAAWRLQIDDTRIDVEIRSWPGDHWNLGAFPYWEGPVEVSGSHSGEGYVEMTGYHGK